MKIDKYYKYSETKIGKEIQFGWIESGNINYPAILTIDNGSVFAASVDDYVKYIATLLKTELQLPRSTSLSNEQMLLDQKISDKTKAFVSKIMTLISTGKSFKSGGIKFMLYNS